MYMNSSHIQEKRLRIHNSCLSEPVWIAHMAGYGTGPDNQKLGELANFENFALVHP